jgi:hypothetical protein
VRHVFCFTQGEKAGKGITESGFNKAFRKARLAAGCPGRIPHHAVLMAIDTLVLPVFRNAQTLTGGLPHAVAKTAVGGAQKKVAAAIVSVGQAVKR